MDKTKIKDITALFKSWSDERIDNIEAIAESGSNRKYFRIFYNQSSVIVAINPDVKENRAFVEFSKQFKKIGLPVAEVLAEMPEKGLYLLEDLGDVSLYDVISKRSKDDEFKPEWIELYKKVLDYLIRFQIEGAGNLDFSLCYPRAKFDAQSIAWDLNYFKYYFLKLKGVDFDEQLLENDFKSFTEVLLSADSTFFMYRDFQSRNIMIKDGEPYFIDFQGGRQAALQYDLASLLYQAKAMIPAQIREELLDYYITEISKVISIDSKTFRDTYHNYVLIRILQTLGAYGYRGYYERKAYFIQSIPLALNNLNNLLPEVGILNKLPELKRCLNEICMQPIPRTNPTSEGLRLQITSFSYMKGIPEDDTDNGGGFVFDCRALPNPGRDEEYKQLTGKDSDVINFFADKKELPEFLNSVYSLVDSSIENYTKRHFSNLVVNFGCTGGQHRSVYCAENLYRHVKSKYDIDVEIRHREQGDI